MVTEFDYDVCLSFAGEKRAYVRAVADALKAHGVRVFYDEYEKVDLWGKDLYAHLSDVYKNRARYCVLFASREYREKLWTNHERQNAQARAFEENKEYILPAIFDDVEIPGVLSTVGHVDLRFVTPPELAQLIQEKIGTGQRELSNYLPPVPDRLYADLGVRKKTSSRYSKTLKSSSKYSTECRAMNISCYFTLYFMAAHTICPSTYT
ncbi:MAG: TIR domain-containing protein [Acidobacteriota bacterium]